MQMLMPPHKWRASLLVWVRWQLRCDQTFSKQDPSIQVAASGVYPPPLPPPAPSECALTASVDPPPCDVDNGNSSLQQPAPTASSATWLLQLLQHQHQHHQGSQSQLPHSASRVDDDVVDPSFSSYNKNSLNSKKQHKHSSIAVDGGCAKDFDQNFSSSSKSVNSSSTSVISWAGSLAPSHLDSVGSDSGDPIGELESVSLPSTKSSFDCAELPVNFAELVELASLITCKVGESVLPVAVTGTERSKASYYESNNRAAEEKKQDSLQQHSSSDSVETKDTVFAEATSSSAVVSEESATQDTFSQLLFQNFNTNLSAHLSGDLAVSGTSNCSKWEESASSSVSTTCKQVVPAHLQDDSGIASNSSNSVSSSKSLYIDFGSSSISTSCSTTVTTKHNENFNSSPHGSGRCSSQLLTTADVVGNIVSSHHHGNAAGKLSGNSTSINPNSVGNKAKCLEDPSNSRKSKESSDSFHSKNTVEYGSPFYPFPYLTPKYNTQPSHSARRPIGFINHSVLEGYPTVDSLTAGNRPTQTIPAARPDLPLPPAHWGNNNNVPKHAIGTKSNVNQYLESGSSSFGGGLQYQDPLAQFSNNSINLKSGDHFADDGVAGGVDGISLTNRLVRQLQQVQQALEERSIFNNQQEADPGAPSKSSFFTGEGYHYPARYFPLHPPTVAAAFRNILSAAAAASSSSAGACDLPDNRQRQPGSANSSTCNSFDESEQTQRANSSQFNQHLRFERKGSTRVPEAFEGNGSDNSNSSKKCGWYRKPATGDQLSSTSQTKSQGLHQSLRGSKPGRRRGSPPTRVQHSCNNNTSNNAGNGAFATFEETRHPSSTVFQQQQHSSSVDQRSAGWSNDSSANPLNQFTGPLLQPYYTQNHHSNHNHHHNHLPLIQAPPPPTYYTSNGRFVHHQQFPFLSAVDSHLVSKAPSSSTCQLTSSNCSPHSPAPGLPQVTLGAPSYCIPETGYPQHQPPPPSLVASFGPPSCSCLYCCAGGSALEPIVGAYLPHSPLNAMVRSSDRHAKYGTGQPPPHLQQNVVANSERHNVKGSGTTSSSSSAASLLKKTPSSTSTATSTTVIVSTANHSNGGGTRNDASNGKGSGVYSKQTGNSHESSVNKTTKEQSAVLSSTPGKQQPQLKSGSGTSGQLLVSQNIQSSKCPDGQEPSPPPVSSKKSKKRKKNANKRNKSSPADTSSGDGATDAADKSGQSLDDGGRMSASNSTTERQNNRRNRKGNGVAVADSKSILNCLFGGGSGDNNRQPVSRQQQQRASLNRNGRGAGSASSTPPPPPPPTSSFYAAPPHVTNIGKGREQHSQQQFASLPPPPPHSRYQQQNHNQLRTSEPQHYQHPFYHHDQHFHQHYPPPFNNNQINKNDNHNQNDNNIHNHNNNNQSNNHNQQQYPQHYQQHLLAPPSSRLSFPPVSATQSSGGPSVGQCVPSSHPNNSSSFGGELSTTNSTPLLQQLSSTFGHPGVAVSFATSSSTIAPPPPTSHTTSIGLNEEDMTDTTNRQAVISASSKGWSAEGKSGIFGTPKELEPVKVFLEEALLSSSSSSSEATSHYHNCQQQTRGFAENSKRSYAAAASNSLHLYQPPPYLPPLVPGQYSSLPQFSPFSQYSQQYASGHSVHSTTAASSSTLLSTTNEVTGRQQLPPLFSQPPPLSSQLSAPSSGYYPSVRTPLPHQFFYHPNTSNCNRPLAAPSTTTISSSSTATADWLRLMVSTTGPLMALPIGNANTTTTSTTFSSSSPSLGEYSSNLLPGCGRVAVGHSEVECCSEVTGTEDAPNAVFTPSSADAHNMDTSSTVKTCTCCTGKCSENENTSSQKNSFHSAPTATLKLRFGTFSPTDDSLLPSPDGTPSVTFTNLPLAPQRASHSVISTAGNLVTLSTSISANLSPANCSPASVSGNENLSVVAATLPSSFSRSLLSLDNFAGTDNTIAGGGVPIGYPRNTTSNPIERDVENMISNSYSAALPAMRGDAFSTEARWEQVERSLVAVVEAEHLNGERQPPSANQSTSSAPLDAAASLDSQASASPPGAATGAHKAINLDMHSSTRSRGRRGHKNSNVHQGVAAGPNVNDCNNRDVVLIPVVDENAAGDHNPNDEEEVVVAPARCSCNLSTCPTCTGEDTGYSSRCSTPPAAGVSGVAGAATPGNNNRRMIPAPVNDAGLNISGKRMLSASATGFVASSGASSIGDEEDCSDNSPDGDDTSDGEGGRGRVAARRGRHLNMKSGQQQQQQQQQQWRRFKQDSGSCLPSPSASMDLEMADSSTRSSRDLPSADADTTSNKISVVVHPHHGQQASQQDEDDEELQLASNSYSPLSGGLGYPGYESSSVEDNADTASLNSVSSARGGEVGHGKGKGGDGYRRHNGNQQHFGGGHQNGAHRGGYYNNNNVFGGEDNYFDGDEDYGYYPHYYQQRGIYNGGNRNNSYNNFNNFRNHYYSNNNNNGGNRGGRSRGKGNNNNNGYYNNGYHGNKTNNGDFPNNSHFNNSYHDGSIIEPSDLTSLNANHRSNNNNNTHNNTARSGSNSNSFSANNSVNGSTCSLLDRPQSSPLLLPFGQQRPASSTAVSEKDQDFIRLADATSLSASGALQQGTVKVTEASPDGGIDKASVEAAGTKLLSEFVQGTGGCGQAWQPCWNGNRGLEKNSGKLLAPVTNGEIKGASPAASDAAIISSVADHRFVQQLQQQSQHRRYSMDAGVLDESRRSSVVSLPPLPSECKGLLMGTIELVVRQPLALPSRIDSSSNSKSTSLNIAREAPVKDHDTDASNNKADVGNTCSIVTKEGYTKDSIVKENSSPSQPLPPPHPLGRSGPSLLPGFRFPLPAMGGPPVPPHPVMYPQHHLTGGPKPWHFGGGVNGGGRFPFRPPFGGRGGYNHNNSNYYHQNSPVHYSNNHGGGGGAGGGSPAAFRFHSGNQYFNGAGNPNRRYHNGGGAGAGGVAPGVAQAHGRNVAYYDHQRGRNHNNHKYNSKHHHHDDELDVHSASDCESDSETAGDDLMTLKEIKTSAGTFDLMASRSWTKTPSPGEIEQHVLDYHTEVKDTPKQLLDDPQHNRLSQQIWDLFYDKHQKDDTLRKKHELRTRIFKALQADEGIHRLLLVGSSVTGFGVDESDVDLCLRPKGGPNNGRVCKNIDHSHHPHSNGEEIAHLRAAYEKLRQCPWIGSNMEVIPATVPILRLTDAVSKLQVDINVESTVGIRNTHLLHSYAQCDWRVRPLVVCVKVWAASKNINCARDGTVSSYSLALMVIHYLQCGVSPPVLPCLQQCLRSRFAKHATTDSIHLTQPMPRFTSANTDSLGKLLLGFLHYYATFRYDRNALAVRYGKVTSIHHCAVKDTDDKSSCWTYLCIQEPFNFTNTARSVFNGFVFTGIMRTFDRSYQQLSKCKNLNDIIKVVNSSLAVPRSLTSNASSLSKSSTNPGSLSSLSNERVISSPFKPRPSSAFAPARSGDDKSYRTQVETKVSKSNIETDNGNKVTTKPAMVQGSLDSEQTQMEKVTKTIVVEPKEGIKSHHCDDVHKFCNGSDDVQKQDTSKRMDGVDAVVLLSSECTARSSAPDANSGNASKNPKSVCNSSNASCDNANKRVPIHDRPIVAIEADGVAGEMKNSPSKTNSKSANKTQQIDPLGKRTHLETDTGGNDGSNSVSSTTTISIRPTQQPLQATEVSKALFKSVLESREGSTVGRKEESMMKHGGDMNSITRAPSIPVVKLVLKTIQNTGRNNLQLQQSQQQRGLVSERSGVHNKISVVPIVSHVAASMDKVAHLADTVNPLCLKC